MFTSLFMKSFIFLGGGVTDGKGFVAKKPGSDVPSDSRGGTSTLIASLWGQGITSTKLALVSFTPEHERR